MKFNKEDLIEAMKNIAVDNTLIVEIGGESLHGKWDSEMKIRFMPTAGGFQFCVKEVSTRGEGGGAYFRIDQVEEAADYAISITQRKEESGKRFSERFNRPFMEREMKVREDNFHRSIHLDSIENDPILKDAATITLS